MKVRVYKEDEPSFTVEYDEYPLAAVKLYCHEHEDPNEAVTVIVEPIDGTAKAFDGWHATPMNVSKAVRTRSAVRRIFRVRPVVEWVLEELSSDTHTPVKRASKRKARS